MLYRGQEEPQDRKRQGQQERQTGFIGHGRDTAQNPSQRTPDCRQAPVHRRQPEREQRIQGAVFLEEDLNPGLDVDRVALKVGRSLIFFHFVLDLSSFRRTKHVPNVSDASRRRGDSLGRWRAIAPVWRWPERRWRVGRLCLAFADGQGFALEVSEEDGVNGKEIFGAWFRMMREAISRALKATANGAVVRFGRVAEASNWTTPKALHDGLLESHPIRLEAGFEGNPGVEGGAWRPSDGHDDGLVHLRFAAGTEDLPLHVHEFSDRLLVVTSGIGLFHYLPDANKSRELRSVVVEAGDAVLFTRGVVHTFTAPLGDLTLLSYHAPFFEFDDARQFKISTWVSRNDRDWRLATITAR